MDIRFILVVLRTRYALILFTLLVAVSTAAGLTYIQPKQYLSYTSLVLNLNDSNPFEQAGVPAQLSTIYIATQLDIIQSQKVALEVVRMLELDKDEQLRRDYMEATQGVGISHLEWIAMDLMQRLQIEPSRDSRVVRIGFMSTDPREAARVADAFAQAYVAVTLELSMEPARRSAVWFNQQLKVLRERLDDAQSRLTSYQQEHGIVALDERLDTETSRLNELSKNHVAAQAELYDVQSRQLGQNHPEYQRAIERERSLTRSLDRQKSRLLELKEQRDEMSALAREVENEQRNFDATIQSYYQTRLESQFNQTSIAVLSPAVVPQLPVSPNVLLNIASSIFLGLLFGIALAIVSEVINRKIRTEDDVMVWMETEVLGVV